MKKMTPLKAGLCQSFGVVLYVGIVATIINLFSNFDLQISPFFGIVMTLLLLVVSAAITGSLVLAYSVYLAMHKDIKKALMVLGYTLLFLIMAVLGLIIFISIK